MLKKNASNITKGSTTGSVWGKSTRLTTGSGKTKASLKGLVGGRGINDLNHQIFQRMSDGTIKTCPKYYAWSQMMQRSNPNGSQYTGTTVDARWSRASVFFAWLDNNNWVPGNHIDKDILIPGNRHYSPETCLVVPRKVNLVVKLGRGYMVSGGRFATRVVQVDGSEGKLLKADTRELCMGLYRTEKAKVVREHAKLQNVAKIRDALNQFAANLESNLLPLKRA